MPPIVVTAKNQSPGVSGDDIEAAKGKARQSRHRRDLGVSPATLYRYIPAAGTANFPERCRVQLNQADRLGVYVGTEIHGDFSPGLQL
jgi:hypothetical protein